MREKLKPCPFCGNVGEVEHEEKEYEDGEDWMRVVCQHCGGNSGWYLSESMATEAWNRRSQA